MRDAITPDPITAVPGFRAAGVEAGIKKRGGLDLALIVADSPCAAAAVFTQNQVQAAPVVFDRELVRRNPSGLRAVVINSGCANAVTGAQGMRNVETTAQAVIEALDLPCDSVFVMSTGVIGEQLPMHKLLPGIRKAAMSLAVSHEAGHAAARAIMTTDTRPKTAALRLTLGDSTITIAGMCKGAGMIHPNMATMLALVCTDAAIDPAPLDAALRHAAERSFNCMSIDGDTSTNDTLLALANGSAGVGGQGSGVGDQGSGIRDQGSGIRDQGSGVGDRINSVTHKHYELFRDGLTAVCVELAKMVARDGEGATKLVTIEVTGARSFEEARRIGRTIATSNLVKTAIFGTDANWGRVLGAVGRAGVPIDPHRLALWFGDVQLVGDGAPLAYAEADAHATLLGDDVFIRVDLGLGDESAMVWTCDFSHEYVSINADYRT